MLFVGAGKPVPTKRLLFFEQPLARARRKRRYFIRLRGVDRLENLQLLALARKDPRIAYAIQLQPDAVIAAAHGCAITGQAQRVPIDARQSGDFAVGLELDRGAVPETVGDLPVAAHIGCVQRTFEVGAQRRAFWSRLLGAGEQLFGLVVVGQLQQLFVFSLEFVCCVFL